MSELIPIVHVIAGVRDLSEGPTASVSRLCSELAGRGHDITLMTLYEPAAALDSRVHVEVYPPLRLGGYLGLAPQMWRRLRQRATKPAILHDHCLWRMPNIYAGWIASDPNIRLVVSPRGMLSEWALNYRRWRKRAAWWLLGQRHLLARADAFHATAESEAEEIRALGYRQPVYVVPNGVEIPELPASCTMTGRRRHLVFLSRIHPKKGVDLLLHAWQALCAQFRDWDLVIAGPDNDGHMEEMRRLAKELALERVSFPGAIYAQAKRDLFLSTDLFVLPTRSENFGMVVAEALAYGVPVVTTKGAPWEELRARQCGWWVDVGALELGAALREAMSLSADERRAMGERGRNWMSDSLSWSRQTDALVQCYRDLWAGLAAR